MKKRAKIVVLIAVMLSIIPANGCGSSGTEHTESSEILMIEADVSENDHEEEIGGTTVTTVTAEEKTTTAAKRTTVTVSETAGITECTEQITEEIVQDEGYEETPVESVPDETVPAPTEAPAQPPAEAPTLPPENLTLKLGEDCSQYVTNTPYLSMTEGISCMGEGYDRIYDYGDYIVYTFADYAATGDFVQEIDLLTDMYSTDAGIRVGNTRSDVEAVYGTTDTGRYASSEGGYLMFMYDDSDVVTLIMYCKD